MTHCQHGPERDIVKEWDDFYSQWSAEDRHIITERILSHYWKGAWTSWFWHGPCQHYTDEVNRELDKVRAMTKEEWRDYEQAQHAERMKQLNDG